MKQQEVPRQALDSPLAPGPIASPTAPPALGRSLIVIAPLLLALVTFLFWYLTWFGRQLTDREMDEYLTDTSVPHKTQHALSQLADRIARGDATARRWYALVLKLASNQEGGLRAMSAWVMGQDSQSSEFHQALRKLLVDPEPAVRANAALGLVRFQDASGEPELRLMLRPYTVVAPGNGTIKFRVKEQDAISAGSVVARIEYGDRATTEVRSPLAGKLERRTAADGARVVRGDPIAVLSPGEEQVWEALRALLFVGQPDDLEDVEHFAGGVPGMSERVRQQAALTAKAIRRRARS
jgi:hypothetical protein